MIKRFHTGDTTVANLLVCILLILSVLIVYFSLFDADFISFDDSVYVYENPHVRNGFTRDGILRAFSFRQESGPYWHPVTTLSHMGDCQIFGLDPGKHHGMNILIHLANTLLLFLFFLKTTGETGKSAFVASVFALHPLNVESVAWISERKNLLCVFFWLLNMHVFVRYTGNGKRFWYVLFVLLFAAGIMSKPLMMTFPFTLLLINLWPLDRYSDGRSGFSAGRGIYTHIAEVIPLILLMTMLFYAGMFSGGEASRVTGLEGIPAGLRISNALVSYCTYLLDYLLPVNLSVFNPYPESVSLVSVIGAVVFLTGVSGMAIAVIKTHPWLFVGWFWFVGNLVTASGLIQKGYWPSHADRFTYLPMIGITVIAAWGIPAVLKRFPLSRNVLTATCVVVVAVLSVVSFRQAGYWKNGETLFRHAIEVNPADAVSMANLALALGEKGKTEEAIDISKRALDIKPGYPEVLNNLGVLYSTKGETQKALECFRKAVEVFPGLSEARMNAAVALNNNYPDAASALAQAYMKTGHYSLAEAIYLNLLNSATDSRASIAYNLTCLYSVSGNEDKAVIWFEQALEAGFRSWETAERDPDLENLRSWEGYSKLEAYYR